MRELNRQLTHEELKRIAKSKREEGEDKYNHCPSAVLSKHIIQQEEAPKLCSVSCGAKKCYTEECLNMIQSEVAPHIKTPKPEAGVLNRMLRVKELQSMAKHKYDSHKCCLSIACMKRFKISQDKSWFCEKATCGTISCAKHVQHELMRAFPALTIKGKRK